MKLCVNIDHIATLRNARGGDFPSPLHAAFTVLEAGAFNVTCHLREDRRHIKENDIRLISEQTKRLNLEMAANDEIISIALYVIPRSITLVPEKRQELTTEGGLNVALDIEKYKIINNKFRSKGINVSAFIEPDELQIEAAKKADFNFIEIHTGKYAQYIDLYKRKEELSKIKMAAEFALNIGLNVNAGHGLNYENTGEIAEIEGLYELNIGYSIVTHAIFAGLSNAVREMLEILKTAELIKHIRQ